MKILSVCAKALTPASPIIPIARPAARELKPQHNPDARWENPLKLEYAFSPSPGLTINSLYWLTYPFELKVQQLQVRKYQVYQPW